MSQQTKQQDAIAQAAALASLMGQMSTLQDSVNTYMTTYNNNLYASVWSQLATAAVNADGSMAAIDSTAGSGTIAVTSGSQSITFSTSQTSLAGKYLTVVGDATNGQYLILSGSGTSWVIATSYAGATQATAAWGTSTPNTSHPIVVPPASPLLYTELSLSQALAVLIGFQSFMAGSTVTGISPTPRVVSDALNK